MESAPASVLATPVAAQPKRRGFNQFLKWSGIGCGGLIGLFVLLIILGAILAPEATEEQPAELSSTAAPDLADAPYAPTPVPTPVPTPTTVPTPTPVPIEITVSELLDQYDQNKARAKARFRYLDNGKVPVSISGIVSDVDEHYVDIASSRDDYNSVKCYYSDIRSAFELDKGQRIEAVGKISDESGFSSSITMYDCALNGIDLSRPPTALPSAVKNNAVIVYCLNEGIFSASGRGSGVVMDPLEGTILTVHHVIAPTTPFDTHPSECDTVEVEFPDYSKRLPASIVKHCASIDRALLKVNPEGLAGLPLQPIHRATAPAQTDQEVYFWGFGAEALRKEIGVVTGNRGGEIITDIYAIPGDSGSPVFNEYGHLLGTVSRSNISDRMLFTGEECLRDTAQGSAN